VGTLTLDNGTPNFRDMLDTLLKNRTDSVMTDANRDYWLNSAYQHMCLPSVHRFRELETDYDITLALSDYDYTLAEGTVGFKITGVGSIFHVMSTAAAETPTTQKRKLSPRSIRWFDRKTLVAGPPSAYTIYGETLYISGVPRAAEVGQLIRVRCWREPEPLSAVGDVTVLASYFDRVLLKGAQWMAERDLGYRDRAEDTKQEYAALLNEAPEWGEIEAENWDYQVDVNPNASGVM